MRDAALGTLAAESQGRRWRAMPRAEYIRCTSTQRHVALLVPFSTRCLLTFGCRVLSRLSMSDAFKLDRVSRV